jgi:isopentenyl-diphosphate delta-isomerase
LNKPAHQVVSSESENLILVDQDDKAIGTLDKAACHNGQGKLHRAFSLFIFNSRGELLLQQRSPQKRLWGGYWSNSCCSHPRVGENMGQATSRRLREELGIGCELHFMYKFEYQAQFGAAGSEHELCSVYLGLSDDQVMVNQNEIAAWRFIDPGQLEQEMTEQRERFTPWFKIEWQRVREHYRDALGLAR